jgi:hypothetical protein
VRRHGADGKSIFSTFNVSFLCSNMIRKEAAVKRDVSLTLSHVRCQLPRGNCFPLKMNSVKRESVPPCARAAPASPADLEQRVCSISMVGKTTTCTLNCDKSNSCNYGGCAFFINAFLLTAHWQHLFFIFATMRAYIYLKFTFGL